MTFILYRTNTLNTIITQWLKQNCPVSHCPGCKEVIRELRVCGRVNPRISHVAPALPDAPSAPLQPSHCSPKPWHLHFTFIFVTLKICALRMWCPSSMVCWRFSFPSWRENQKASNVWPLLKTERRIRQYLLLTPTKQLFDNNFCSYSLSWNNSHL